MLTLGLTGVNGARSMSTIGEIAKREGISAPSVSNFVNRWAKRGLLTVERDAFGRVRAVDIVEYEALRKRELIPTQQAAEAAPKPWRVSSVGGARQHRQPCFDAALLAFARVPTGSRVKGGGERDPAARKDTFGNGP